MESSGGARRPGSGLYRVWRRLLREEDAWLLRQIGSVRPVLWLRPAPLGLAARHGIMALRAGAEGQLRGALRAEAGHWPWADSSIPAIVLQHVCEGASLDARILSEAARVLSPEGRLYILRFDRLSPWYWRYAGGVVRRSGAALLSGRRLPLAFAQQFGLGLEYRHALGSRGFGTGGSAMPERGRSPERWPLLSTLRAARVWVLRKRGRQWLRPGRRSAATPVPAGYGLARLASDCPPRLRCTQSRGVAVNPDAPVRPTAETPVALPRLPPSQATSRSAIAAAAILTGFRSMNS